MDASNLISNATDWFAHPFKSQGSAFNWILFVGLLVIAAWMWNHILMSITD
ncbi:MAG TPA: hypothetical protein VET48_12670 [Steroidobacteraceae bacterium]|nr:hypothetical protein [Steroidobacteraceae bacterium]